MGTLADHRNVMTFDRTGFVKMPMPGLPDEDVWWKNVSYDETAGQGSYLMIMAPGTRCNPHRHNGPEEFYVVEGDLEDCDGHMYRAGAFVSLSGGSAHFSVSHSGCRLVVTHRGTIDDLDQDELEET
ncbi:MAG: cupin domain-containing protein [Roseovarius sp.]|uniref:cupin domain-containing protein n=1 Tax=Roseovarius sp. TaxID=1486281 RepID=UPI0032ED4BD8